MYAFIQLNWNTTLQVPVAEMSKVIETLTKYPLVDSEYADGGRYYYVKSERMLPTIEIGEAAEPARRQAVLEAA